MSHSPSSDRIALRVDAPDSVAELGSLQSWLGDVPQLRGRVDAVHAPPPPGALGPVLDALQVAAVPGGAVAVVASALVAWVQHRSTDVRVRVERNGRSAEVDAKRVRTLDADGMRRLVEAVSEAIADRDATAGAPDAADPKAVARDEDAPDGDAAEHGDGRPR